MADLRLDGISFSVNGAPILKRVTASLSTGELVALVGPNGAGKTTLLKCALGYLKPDAGSVLINGEAVENLSPMKRAQLLSYLPQMRPLVWPARVRDVVALGRYAYGASLRLKGRDLEAVGRALAACSLTGLAERRTDALSGGELARVHCARVFASESPFLLADEPVNSLDPRHQLRVMQLIKDYTKQGRAALVVLHDLALAARFADRLVWMKDGAVVADGDVEVTLTPERLADVFGVRASVAFNEDAPSVQFQDASPPP